MYTVPPRAALYTMFHKNVDRFSKNFHLRTQQRSFNELIIKDSSHLKGVDTYLVKCKCQETTDNMKQMSHLTIKFNLIYYT